jgi:arylsulfatase A
MKPALAAVVTLMVLIATSCAADPPRPNVIVVLCDDLGYGDLGCYGASDVRTPALDRMAADGMRLTDFSVVAPLCTPSRVALMTGRYPGRLGLETGVLRPDATNGLAPEEVTLGEVFQSSGYVTGCIGKWHLGFLPGLRPMDQGFDSYFGVLHNLDKPETIVFEAEGGMPVLRGDEVVARPADPAQMTQLYTAEALQFIEANREKPFFLYLGHAMPHLPFDASPDFKGKSARGLYGDVVEEIDWSLGQILDRLRSLGLAERTLVVFTSDNGPERKTPGTAAPLKGTKHTVFEGGLRVPCVLWWPGHVPASVVSDEFIATLDLLPTFAALAGFDTKACRPLDGFDVSPVLLGESGATSPRQSLFAVYGLQEKRAESARSGDWKLHLTDPPQLYNLHSDPAESRDLATQEPQRVQQLREAFATWRTTLAP